MHPEDKGSYWQPQGGAPQGAATPQFSGPSPEEMPPTATPFLSWQASEYVHHEKERLWFVSLALGALALLAVAIFLIQSITFAVLIVVMSIALGVYAVRQPKIISYQLVSNGIQVNNKLFPFHDFRYFGVIQDGPLNSIVLIPNKRFMPAVNIYFLGENGEAIVDAIGARLPMEHVELDGFDKLMRHLRF